jgi:hypothetical protein
MRWWNVRPTSIGLKWIRSEEIWVFWMAQAIQGRLRRCTGWSKKWADKSTKDRCTCGQSTNLCAPRSKIGSGTNGRRIAYERGNSATDYCWGFGNEEHFRKGGASNLDGWPKMSASGICSGERTQILFWQVDSPPWQCPVHDALGFNEILAKKSVTKTDHRPNSPDLA